MLNRTIFTKGCRTVGVLGTVLLAATACQDLQIDNLNAADRERATANPLDVQALVAGGFFPTFFEAIHNDDDVSASWFAAASGMTATWDGQDSTLQYLELKEPRGQHDNGIVLSVGNGPQGGRDFWAAVHRAATTAYDGLQILDGGMVIKEGNVDVTPRARAFAKFMQGWTWGYLGMMFDKSHLLSEDIDLPQDADGLMEVTLETLKPYTEVLPAAVASLQEAVSIAQQNPNVVQYPSFGESNLWFGAVDEISNADFIAMANTLSARILVMGARNPAERKAVDWNKVLELTANGVQQGQDYYFQLNSSRESVLLEEAQTNDPSGFRNTRWDLRTIGPADQTGKYAEWQAAYAISPDNVTKEMAEGFLITTPDRRITGPTPTSDGSYTRYRADFNGFVPDRGYYLFSHYQWSRHAIRLGKTGTDIGEDEGSIPLITADENNLLRAEALVYLGDRPGAAELINVSRTRPQTIDGVTYPGLPPITAADAIADQVPTVDGACVPRQDDGDCGTLLDAIRYERMIEMAVTDAVVPYADSRGWGTLPNGALIQWPVPGNVLDQYGLEGYSYGGPNDPTAAVYAPVSKP